MIKKETNGLTKKYESNPFTVELKGKMYLQPRANTIIAKGQSIVDMTTGEILDEGILIGKRKIVDKSQFAKIYASEIMALYELSKTAMNIFLYLTKIMDYDNKAYFSYVKDLKKVGYKSKGTAYRAIKELVNSDIIAPSNMVNVWWLNPGIVCKGERFAKYTEYVVGNDNENIKNYIDAEKKIKGKVIGELQPEQVREKYQKANYQTPIDSKNNTLDFQEDNF